MPDQLEGLVDLLRAFPVETVYVLIGAGAAVENIFPPIPSDTFVLLGGVLADRGVLEARYVFGVAWLSNILLASFVYLMGLRYGRAIFETRWGAWILRPHQLRRMDEFYRRYGAITVLVSRFFPVFRVLVPAFAGISRLGFWRTTLPLGLASAVWYGILVAAGIFTSRNVPRLLDLLGQVNAGLLVGALALAALVAAWWWRSRRGGESRDSDGDPVR